MPGPARIGARSRRSWPQRWKSWAKGRPWCESRSIRTALVPCRPGPAGAGDRQPARNAVRFSAGELSLVRARVVNERLSSGSSIAARESPSPRSTGSSSPSTPSERKTATTAPGSDYRSSGVSSRSTAGVSGRSRSPARGRPPGPSSPSRWSHHRRAWLPRRAGDGPRANGFSYAMTSSRSSGALKLVLKDAGFKVSATATAAEALDRASLENPDAAIIDLVLPDGDGIEVCAQIRPGAASRSSSSPPSARKRRRCGRWRREPTTT